ncbi:MAG: hypothetical protein ACLP3K_04575 [Candidatus Acidiferrales bacterium]
MAGDVKISDDPHAEVAEHRHAAGNTALTWLYPGKIPERLRVVKK